MSVEQGGVAVDTEKDKDSSARPKSLMDTENEPVKAANSSQMEEKGAKIDLPMISPLIDLSDDCSNDNFSNSTTVTTNYVSISGLSDSASSRTTATANPTSTDAEETRLAGWLKLAGQGFRKVTKQVWFTYDDDAGKLVYFRQPHDLIPLGDIDVRNASFSYSADNREKPGLFEIK